MKNFINLRYGNIWSKRDKYQQKSCRRAATPKSKQKEILFGIVHN